MFQVLWLYWMLWYNPSGLQGETLCWTETEWLTVSRWEEAITRATLLMEAAQRVCLIVLLKQVGECYPQGHKTKCRKCVYIVLRG